MSDRHPAEWMCTLDERIIERLDENDMDSPRSMSSRMKFNASRDRIKERCEKLSHAGLIAPFHRRSRCYQITEKGEEYLSGTLDAKNLREPPVQIL
jgi:predicted transcriptional regulator